MGTSKKKNAVLLLSSLTLGCLGVGLLFFEGCWASEPSVAGMVQLDGQPVLTGSIRFVPVENTSGSDAGAAIDKGRYEILKGLAEGPYRIEIRSPRSTTKMRLNPAMPTELVPDAVEAIPAEYNRQSKLIKTVKPGSNVIDVDIESKGTKESK